MNFLDLFSVGSAKHSTKWVKKMTETNILTRNITRLRIRTGWRQTSQLFTRGFEFGTTENVALMFSYENKLSQRSGRGLNQELLACTSALPTLPVPTRPCWCRKNFVTCLFFVSFPSTEQRIPWAQLFKAGLR